MLKSIGWVRRGTSRSSGFAERLECKCVGSGYLQLSRCPVSRLEPDDNEDVSRSQVGKGMMAGEDRLVHAPLFCTWSCMQMLGCGEGGQGTQTLGARHITTEHPLIEPAQLGLHGRNGTEQSINAL